VAVGNQLDDDDGGTLLLEIVVVVVDVQLDEEGFKVLSMPLMSRLVANSSRMGSSPSSPRYIFLESRRHVAGGAQQVHRGGGYNGLSNYVDQ
jgi:hypothetical protein